jgi:hypothetical protein
MTIVTKMIGIGFLCTLFFGAIIVDTLDWPSLVYGLPVIGLEIAFFGSVVRDAVRC